MSSRTRFVVTALAATLVTLAAAPFAMAEATRTWVSGVGDDANPCSRTAPCKTFAGAISKTAVRGEISVLDPGGFGGVTITKAITINGRGQLAGVLVSGTNAIVVNAPSTDRVFIRNLTIDGLGTGLTGIKFLAGKSLTVVNTDIFGFTQPGIWMAGAGRLTVRNSEVYDSGYGISAGTATGTIRASIINSNFNHNVWGLFIGAASRVSVTGCETSENSAGGMAARSGGTLNVHDCLVEGNSTGLYAETTGKMRVSSTTVTDNDLGLSFVTGGQLISRGDNTVEDNTTNGAFSSMFSPK
jgi:nitrous oxidase accessory protein NosD